MTLTPPELNGHTGDNEIGTPDDLFEWLMRRFHFTYDAFASHENHLLPTFSTVAGTFRSYGQINLLDGLTFPWTDETVFWNPPYGRGIYTEAIQWAIENRNRCRNSVGLLKYDASTENGRLIRENFHIEYLPRIKYKGMKTAAPFASVLAINKPDRWRS